MDQQTAATGSGALASRSPDETRGIGRSLGAAARPGTVLALRGPLGAGKTQLAKGVAEGLDVASVVNSPTFVLMNEHVGRLRLYHIDAYRLDDADDAVTDGLLDERQASGIVVLEWADRLDGLLPAERLEIEIALVPDEPTRRILRWRACGANHANLADAALRDREPTDLVAGAS